MDDELMKTLRYLRLRGLMAHWDEYMTLARQQHFSPVRLLRYVVEEESKIRQEHARQLRPRSHSRTVADGNLPLCAPAEAG